LQDKKRTGQPKKFEDAEQVLLDENSARTVEELTEALNVGKSIISDRLYAIEKIFKKRQMGSTNCLNWLFKIV